MVVLIRLGSIWDPRKMMNFQDADFEICGILVGMPLWWYLSALDRFDIPAKWWISKMQISRFAEF
jgi:hypothetical protein